jgi:hypothetical protein
MTQNESYVQKAALQLGIFNFLKDLNEEKDPELITIYIYLLTGLLYGDDITTKKYFVQECDGIKLIFNLLVRETKSYKNTKRLLNIYSELTKETDENLVKGGKELRKYIFNQIHDIKLHHKFINMLNDYDYNNQNNCDIIHIIFSIIYNLADLFIDNPAEIYDEIKKMNILIEESNLDNETKKNEKNFLIDIIKNIKSRLVQIKENPNYDDKKDENIEYKQLGNKESMKIKLK